MIPKTNCAPGVITLFLPAEENALLREELSKGMSVSVGSLAAVDKRILSVCSGEIIADRCC